MSKVKGKPIANFLYVLVSLCAIGFLMYAYFRPHLNTKLQMEPVLELDRGWTYVSPEGNKKEITMMDRMRKNQKDGIVISRILPQKDKVDYDTFGLWSVFQEVTIFIDGEPIYSNKDKTMAKRGLERHNGALWNFVKLPENCTGKRLTVSIRAPYKTYQNGFGRAMLGTYSGIYAKVRRDYSWRMILAVLFIAIGCIFGFYQLLLIYKKTVLISSVISSMFAIWFGLWTFSEAHMAPFYTGNAPFISILSFVAVRMATISFLLYFRSVFYRDYRKWNGVILALLCGEFVLSMCLQLLHIRDYYESLGEFIILLGVLIASVFFEIIYTLWSGKYRETKSVLIATLVLGVLVGVDTMLLESGQRLRIPYGVSATLGMLLLVLVFVVSEFVKIKNQALLAAKAEHFEKMAETDALTGVNNRVTENRWLEEHRMLTANEKMKTSVVVCDMNFLKSVNDTYGHRFGDEAIRTMARILKEVFGERGVICRTGGDEFTIFSNTMDGTTLRECIHQLKVQMSEENQKTEYLLSVSAGFAFFDPERDIALENTISRADDAMYHDKMLSKSTIAKR
ncbi:diguanylate cyclase (GGDEF) domain-containing protein [Lachnospiraceae bacterium XBB1006]|nr:diguanylate cyclase (GGDEF) domain-containing protein [Lachnospiraceae bacterium XBB1006]